MMIGGGTTVKFTLLLLIPFTFTTTLPVVAPVGTVVVIVVFVHGHAGEPEGLQAGIPLKVTTLVPWLVPMKFEPLMVTVAPIAACDGLILVMLGAEVGSVTVNVES